MMMQLQGWVMSICLIAVLTGLVGAMCGKGVRQALATVGALAMVLACVFLVGERGRGQWQLAWQGQERLDWEEQSQQLLARRLDQEMAAAIRNEAMRNGIDCTADVISEIENGEYRMVSVTLSGACAEAKRGEVESVLTQQYALTTEQIVWKEEGT